MAGSAFLPSLACLLTGLLLLLQCQAGAAAGITTTATPMFPYQPKGQTIQDFQVLLRVEATAVGTFTEVAVAVVLDVEEHSISYVTDAAKHVKKASGIKGVYVRSSKDGVGWVEEAGLDGATPRGRPDKDESPVEAGLVMARDKMLSAGASGGSIILVTDRADTTVKSFDDRDVPVHILDVGVGSSAIPEALYNAFINKKRGTYSFVDAGADTVELASALAVLVAGLRQVVAPTKTTVKFTVPVTRVRRGGVDVVLSDDKKAFDIDVLYAGEVKNFIVHLDLNVPGTLTAVKKCEEKLLLLGYSVGTDTKTDVYITRPPQDDRYPLPLPMPVPTVVHHMVEFELLEMVQGLMERTSHSPEELADQLLDKWTVLLNNYRFHVGWDLVGLQAEIDKIVSHLREHHEVSYILSWWSGYQAQRPTILGSWENHIAVFVHHTVIKSWTKQVVTLNVNIVIDATDHCKDARQCSAPVNELFSKDTTAAGTFILNPVYRNLSLDKLNFLLRDLFQAACEAERNLTSATTIPVTQ